MTTPMNTINGSARKNLASQLDRLDQILDGLADGLNEAVATAVKQAVAMAVQEAVRGILAEVLTNADLVAKLRSTIGVTTSADSTPQAGQKSRLSKLAAKVGSWFGIGWRKVRVACATATGRIVNALPTTRRQLRLVRQFRVPLLTAVMVGAVAGAGAYSGGPYIAAIAGWIAGFAATLVVQAGIWIRQTFSSFPAARA